VDDSGSIDRELRQLEAELKRLEAEYNMYFAGRLAKPPLETRKRVTALVKKCDRTHVQNYGERFRFATLQSRYSSLIDLWDRGLRAREEGRPGPFASTSPPHRAEPTASAAPDRVLCVKTLHDPAREPDQLKDLYESLAEARRENGEDILPFHKFTELVKNQVKSLRQTGSEDIAFRVMVKAGKVSFTARALKGTTGEK
jgi:hypothetical protein